VSSGKWQTDSGQSRLFFNEFSGSAAVAQDFIFIGVELELEPSSSSFSFLFFSDRTEKPYGLRHREQVCTLRCERRPWQSERARRALLLSFLSFPFESAIFEGQI
jgi:hypothetical protein